MKVDKYVQTNVYVKVENILHKITTSYLHWKCHYKAPINDDMMYTIVIFFFFYKFV